MGPGPIPPYLYGISQGQGDAEGQDPDQAALEALLKALEVQSPPQPPSLPAKPGPVRSIAGNLGDAILAMAAVRAGGAPPALGPFAARMREQNVMNQQAQLEYEKNRQETEAANRSLRNTVRIGQFTEKQRREREESLAKMKSTTKPLRFIPQTVEIDGVPTRVVDVYDSVTGELLGRSESGAAGYAPWIQPAVPGVSPPIRVPRVGPAGPVQGGVMPPPAPGAATAATQSLNMRVLYKDALKSFEDYVGKTSRTQRTITSVGRNIPGVGGIIEETALSYTDPEGVTVARKVDNLADMLLRLRSGAQINDKEFMRLRALLPKLGENPETALANFRRFETELLTQLRINRERAPSLFTPEILGSLGLSEADLGGPANREGEQGGGNSVDDILKEWDQRRQGAQPTP